MPEADFALWPVFWGRFEGGICLKCAGFESAFVKGLAAGFVEFSGLFGALERGFHGGVKPAMYLKI